MDAITAGAILVSSWGYEQTNVDFYRVAKARGDWLFLQQIAADETSDGAQSMTGRAVPAEPVRALSGEFRRKVIRNACGTAVKVSRYAYAQLWDGTPQRTSCYA